MRTASRVGQFRGPHAGPAQARYCDYFGAVLYAPTLPAPAQATLTLSQIVFSGFELLNTAATGDAAGDSAGMWMEDDSAPFLVVFQYGRSVWAGFPETRVRGARCLCCAWPRCSVPSTLSGTQVAVPGHG
jgi:hypothetical protein